MQYRARFIAPHGVVVFVLATLVFLTSCGAVTSSNPPQNTIAKSRSQRYLYVAYESSAGGVRGFRVDPSGTLAEVPGSPVVIGGANLIVVTGALATADNHVFVGINTPGEPMIRDYAADSVTGGLGAFTDYDAGAPPNMAGTETLVTDSAGQNLYAVFHNAVASFQIKSDGSLSYLGTLSNLACESLGSLAISPTASAAYIIVENSSPKGVCGSPATDILLLDRDPATGALSNSHKLMGQTNIWPGTPQQGGLGISPSGTFLLTWALDAHGEWQTADYSIHPATNAISLATPQIGPASPFAFAPDGSFLYLTGGDIVTYSFNEQTGAANVLQKVSPGNANLQLVDDAFVFARTVGTTIAVLPRSASTGMLSAPAVMFNDSIAGTLGQFGELGF